MFRTFATKTVKQVIKKPKPKKRLLGKLEKQKKRNVVACKN